MPTRNIAIRVHSEGKAELKRDLMEIGAAGTQAQENIAGATDKANAAMDRQLERWKRQAAAARDAEAAMAKNAAISAQLGLGGGSGKSAEESAAVFAAKMGGGISRGERAGRLNLVRQGADVFTTGMMGMDPGMIAIQQGPQILDALATSGIKLTPVMIGVGAAVAASAVAVGAMAVASQQAEANLAKLENVANGLGATAGLTGGQLERLAQRNAEAGEVAVSTARELSAAYGSTGRIGEGVIGGLIAVTRKWAVTTQQDVSAASAQLAKGFADPAKGAADLNEKLNFLSAAELRHIQLLARAGDAAGAQAEMLGKLNLRLEGTATATTQLGSAWDVVARSAQNAWDWMGRAIYRSATGGAQTQGLEDMRAQLTALKAQRARGDDDVRIPTADGEVVVGRVSTEIARLSAEIQRQETVLQRAAANQKSLEVQGLVDRYNPNAAKLAELKADRQNLASANRQDPEAKKALADLDKEIAALSAGYRSASAQATAFGRANRAALKDAKDDGRDYLRGIEIGFDLINFAQQRDAGIREQALELERKVAIILGESVDYLDRQAAFEELIARYRRAGLNDLESYNRALADTVALSEAEAKARSQPKDFVSTADRMARSQDLFDKLQPETLRDKLDGLKWPLADAIGSGFEAVNYDRSFGEGFGQCLKRAAIRALSDSAISSIIGGLFGNKATGSAGLISTVLGQKSGGEGAGLFSTAISWASKLIGRNAKGTDNWRGGLTWVGEEGPELLNVPKGAEIFSNERSRAMTGGITVQLGDINVSGGASMEEVEAAVERGVRRAIDTAKSEAGPAALDYLDRAQILKKP